MKKTIFSIMAAAMLCACNVQVHNPDEKSYDNHDWGNGNGVTTPVELKLTARQQQLLKQSNEFSLNLLKQVYANETDHENVIISPLSASMALSMLMNGADNETLSQVKNTLGFGDWTDEEVNEYNHLMLTALPCLDTCTHMTLANSLWLHEGFPVKDDFININKQYFMAQVQNVDFTDPETANLINAWAAKHTNDLIKKVVSPEQIASCVTLLANALYFKGIWADKFDKDLTKDGEFKSSKSVKQIVDMMYKHEEIKYVYLKDHKAQLAELDYLGGAYCMDLLLPADDSNIPTLLNSLQADEMPGWEDKFWPEQEILTYDYETDEEKTVIQRRFNDVILQMPKFTLRYERKLNDDLKALGMKDMFIPGVADFSRLSDVETYIDFVKQDTYMSVDEAGTEAAAVTTIGYTGTSIEQPKYPEMILNRPFVLFIREKQYGTIIFAAVIGNPNEKE